MDLFDPGDDSNTTESGGKRPLSDIQVRTPIFAAVRNNYGLASPKITWDNSVWRDLIISVRMSACEAGSGCGEIGGVQHGE
jgi:hypothetical protein